MTNWSDCWVDTGGMASTEDAKPKAKAVAADATKARFFNATSHVVGSHGAKGPRSHGVNP